LGVGVRLCDPHHPAQNGFVERYHRTYQQECLAVDRPGSVRVDLKSYYVGRALAGQQVALHLSAAKRALLVVYEHQVLKTLPLKGLTGQAIRFEAFVQLMMGQARSERRLRNAQERRIRLGASDSP
jgi:hypothetical protein